jgi:hypothetical protein
MRKLFIVFICLHGLLNAQNPGQDVYTVYINYPDYSIRTEVSSASQKINASRELEYYWYASNKIYHTHGGCDGKILNGQFASFYLSNNLKEKGTFKKGLKNGDWIAWFENGHISETSEWKSGRLHGTYSVYNEKGEIVSESTYRNGRLNGYRKTYEQGVLKEQQRYRHGKEIVKATKEPKKAKQENTAGDQEQKVKKGTKEKVKKENTGEPSGAGAEKEKKETGEKATKEKVDKKHPLTGRLQAFLHKKEKGTSEPKEQYHTDKKKRSFFSKLKKKKAAGKPEKKKEKKPKEKVSVKK